MDFQIGDNVVIKNTSIEGTFAGVENDEMFIITQAGKKLIVLKDNLENENFDWEDPIKKKKKELKKAHVEQKPIVHYSKGSHWERGFYLVFFPEFVQKDIHSFKVYLINQDSVALKCAYKVSLDHAHITTEHADMPPYTCVALQTITLAFMQEIPQFDINLEWDEVAVGHIKNKVSIKLRAKKLFGLLQQIQNGDIQHIAIPIEKNVAADLNPVIRDIPIKIENKIQQLLESKKRIDEIDIHIEKLNVDYHNMSNAEIIQYQLEQFEKVLHHAISLNQDALTVIHGVGKGVLKDEIHALLRMYKEVRHFINDWSPKYGYGATQIFFYT